MKNIIKQLRREAKQTRLSSAEKVEIKATLFQYIKLNPVRDREISQREFVSNGTHSTPSPFFASKFRNKRTISALVIGSLLVGGSVSFAAENTVPGDLLYPVKINVNEQVRSAIAITPQAKAEWGVELVNRRLTEVEKLAVAPNIATSTREIATENLIKYTKKVEQSIKDFESNTDSKDALNTTSNLSEVLGSHEKILVALHSDVADMGTAISSSSTISDKTASSSVQGQDARGYSTLDESIKSALENVRESIKNISEKNAELKKKYNAPDASINISNDASVGEAHSDSNIKHTSIFPEATVSPDTRSAISHESRSEEIRSSPSAKAAVQNSNQDSQESAIMQEGVGAPTDQVFTSSSSESKASEQSSLEPTKINKDLNDRN